MLKSDPDAKTELALRVAIAELSSLKAGRQVYQQKCGVLFLARKDRVLASCDSKLKKLQRKEAAEAKTAPKPTKKGTVAGKADGSSHQKKQRPVPDEEERKATKEKLLVDRQALPIWGCRKQLIDEIRANPVLVVVGETGSGKSTQLPQLFLEAGLLPDGQAVGVTQPRRVAAVSLARRVSAEAGAVLGDLVGYSVRFDDASSPATRVKYLTDGMLLREALLDPTLARYAAVVLDEAHERTVHTDVLLGLLKGVLERRPGGAFRLLVMSATLNAGAFSEFFGGCKAVYVQGRQHPVDVHYTRAPEDDYLDAALATALQIHAEEAPGDMLIFLTGQEEIDSMHRLLVERAGAARGADGGKLAPLLVAPLYAALPPEQQMAVFEPAPSGTRKVVLATNIAETSLTIPGIRYVVDPGLSKQRHFNPRSGVDTLAVGPISRAAARQRAGRAGRDGPGKCFRLYTEETFEALQASTAPEILRTNLGGVVLQLKALGVDDVLGFPFIDPPPRGALVRSLELLFALEALDEKGRLTAVGRAMARFPLEPMAAKALLAAQKERCVDDVCATVAMLDTEGLFFTPKDKFREAKAARERFHSGEGDLVMLLKIFREYRAVGAKTRGGWCRDHCLSIRALQRAEDVYAQLSRAAEQSGMALESCPDDTTKLRRALTAGYFLQAARRQPDGSYKAISSGQVARFHPSGALHGRPPGPECVVYTELVQTTKMFIRGVSTIEISWLSELAPRFYATRGGGAAAAANGAAGDR